MPTPIVLSRRALLPAVGVLSGWLVVQPGAVSTVALSMRQFDPNGLPTAYSMTIATAWLTLIAALVAFGFLGDRLQARRRSRRSLLVVGLAGILLTSVLCAVARSPVHLGVGWVLLQVPAAAVIVTSMSAVGERAPERRRGLASGLIGSAPIAALLVGIWLVRLSGDQLWLAFLAPAILATLISAPLVMHMIQGPDEPDAAGHEPAASLELKKHATGVTRLLWLSWLGFLIADGLISIATAVANGYIVPFVQHVIGATGEDVARIATSAVFVSSALALIGSMIGGLASAGVNRSMAVFAVGSTGLCIALAAITAVPVEAAMIVGGAFFGLSFGVANGAELALAVGLRRSAGHLGRDLGVLTAVTSIPYVLVPLLAVRVLSGEPRSGLIVMFVGACVSALASALLLAVLGGARSRQQRTP